MIAADTSTVVAAFASWHENHEAARAALDSGLLLIDHCALETYSVLTRFPPPHRAEASLVREFLQARFPDPWLRMTPRAYRDFVVTLARRGISGGAAYDALVAATAASHGAELVTCDRRARGVYDAWGLRIRLLG